MPKVNTAKKKKKKKDSEKPRMVVYAFIWLLVRTRSTQVVEN